MMFGESLKRVLDERGKSQKWLADQTRIAEVSISRYVSGKRVPDAYAVLKICNALNCSVDELLEIEQPNIKKEKRFPCEEFHAFAPSRCYACSALGLRSYFNCGAKIDGKEDNFDGKNN